MTANSSVEPQEMQPTKDPCLALCLSGGGFRATFFHLGVIRFLRDRGFLQYVRHIYSVSGGSILAGHLAIHWNAYCDSLADDGFHRASSELVRFGLLDLRGRIVRRQILLGWLFRDHRRTRQLEIHYSRLFGKTEIGEIGRDGPEFRFVATSMTTGDCCVFTRDGFGVVAEDGLRKYTAPDLPLALAVAASSAFPPLFPPVTLTREAVHASEAELPYSDRLSDGGVFDNIGISVVKHDLSTRQTNEPEFIIVSDASAAFDWRLSAKFGGIVSRTARATDILMQRVSRSERVSQINDKPVVWLSIENVVNPTVFAEPGLEFLPQDRAIQRMLKNVRTDLDFFSLDEIRALVRHGYEVAWNDFHRLAGHSRWPFQGPAKQWEPWDPCPPGWPDYANILKYRKATYIIQTIQPLEDLNKEFRRKLQLLSGEFPSEDDSKTADTSRHEEESRALSELRKRITVAANRRVGLWNKRDWVSWLLVLILFAFIAGLAIFFRSVWMIGWNGQRP